MFNRKANPTTAHLDLLMHMAGGRVGSVQPFGRASIAPKGTQRR